MNTSRQRLLYLFERYYSKTATPQERDELFTVINAGANDHDLADALRRAWDELTASAPIFDESKMESILNNILNDGRNTRPNKKNSSLYLWARFAMAATLLLFAGAGLYTYLSKQPTVRQKKITKVQPRPKNDALPGGTKALLTLANGQTIVLDNAQNGTLAKQGSTIIKKTEAGRLVYNAAAKADASAAISINTIATPRGGEYQVILPDDTKVWLNAASSISFPTRFTGKTRDVEITGEAYFEVTKNAAMPFHVKTYRGVIEVLGTHFNVMAYNDEKLMKTTLLEGAVNVRLGNVVSKLKPGQQAQIDVSGNTNVINDVDLEDEIAWKNGIFQFRDAGLAQILRQASRWYDVDVVYKGNIPQREFNGRLSRKVKASELLKMLEYTGVNVSIQGKKLIVN
ncbi:DUF4974 domain-containing protein [Mucilaginibacter pallidiroseus]|uniref:DUF4974 domain-containing protein n=1 Tax=Mucilaginibacter pallidiroseus TaxID=2599295 RepID=A0A563UJY2_9SPHI|nr:FecR family protein [Mucilaginibacter pallidiroseus]TWR31576.1 DUF4974 domain-containing protein [Mucilaginibacter pallidiroseus]